MEGYNNSNMPIGFMTPKEATREMHRGLEQTTPRIERGRPPRKIQTHVVGRIDLTPIGTARHGRIHVVISQPQRYEDAGILDELTGHTTFQNAMDVEETATQHPIVRDFTRITRSHADTFIDRATHDGGRATTRRGKKA